MNPDYNAAKNTALKLALKLQQGQKSLAGGALSQQAPKLEIVSVIATKVACNTFVSTKGEFTNEPTASVVGSRQ